MRDASSNSVTLDLGAVSVELPGPIRQYQWEGINFLLGSSSALLADEMGLGKTVQAILAIFLVLLRPDCNRALVVVPASLRLNWQRELARWAPSLTVRRLTGSSRDRAALYGLPVPVIIASFDQVRQDIEAIRSAVHFDVVVLDEAQRIKNRDSETSLACKLLPRSRSWILTGTPVENEPGDLVSLFGFVRSGLLRDHMSREEMHRLMQPYFLRRHKIEVLAELPPIIRQDIPVELQGAQRDAYDRLWETRTDFVGEGGLPATEMHLFALITKLKQLCNYDSESGESAKGDALSTMFEDLTETTDKVIVFSQYLSTLRWLSHRLGTFPHDLYHGEQEEQERERALARFRTAGGPRALLVSLRAGGVGLNLQEASTVVMFDRWWNPAVEEQAINRAHRFGRERPLHVIRFLATDTIEQRISEILDEKRQTFAEYVGLAESAPVRLFSRAELTRLLALRPKDVDG